MDNSTTNDPVIQHLDKAHGWLTAALWMMLVPLILGGVVAVAAGVWVFLVLS